MGVSVAPGAIKLTVMRRGASSMAQLRTSPTSAAFVAAYWLRPTPHSLAVVQLQLAHGRGPHESCRMHQRIDRACFNQRRLGECAVR